MHTGDIMTRRMTYTLEKPIKMLQKSQHQINFVYNFICLLSYFENPYSNVNTFHKSL